MRLLPALITFFLVCAAVFLSGCGGEDRGGATPPPPPNVTPDLEGGAKGVAAAVRRRLAAAASDGGPDAWGRLAACLEVHGFYPEARRAYAYLRELEPEEWRWPYFEGLCARREDQGAATEAFAAAVRLRGDHVPLLVSHGESLLQSERHEEARSFFESARAADPACAPAWRGLAQLALRDGDLATAAKAVQEALRLAPDYKQAHLLAAELARRGDDQEALGRHREAASRCSDEEPLPDAVRDALWWEEGVSEKWRLLRAAQLRKAGQTGRAVAEWRELLALEPDSVVGRSELALCLAHDGKAEAALSALKDAIDGGADEIGLTLAVGGALTRVGAHERALPLLEKVVAARPGEATARADLGVALSLAGRHAEALPHLRTAAAELPGDARVLSNLALALAASGLPGDAAEVLEKVVEADPDDPTVYDRLAMQRMRARNPEGALAACRQGLRRDPGNATTANRLAWLLATIPEDHLRNGPEAARIAGELSAAAGHRNPVVLDTLAAAQAELGDFEKAVASASRAVALAPDAVASGRLDAGHAQRMQRRLEQYYRAGRKYRGPP